MRRKENTNSKAELRWPVLVLGLVLFGLWVLMILRVDPEIVKSVWINNAYVPFFVLFGLWFMCFVYILSISLIRTLVWSIAMILFLILRLSGLGHILNALLLLSLLVTFEFTRKNNKVI